MSRIKLKKVDQISRKTVSDARDGFLRHCQLKNLAPHTYTYYKENLQFFIDSAPQVKFVDEFNQEVIENFIAQLMDKGNRVTAINARLRAVFVFLRYCFEQEYKAIINYILHYTEPNDIVLDGFCGTGMTGVAAKMCGAIPELEQHSYKRSLGEIKFGARKAILFDLSPAATHISNRYE